MGKNRIVILGNGVAALSAIETIRRKNRECEITVISEEDVPAYSKVLIPYLISGEKSDICIRTRGYYDKTGVKTSFGRKVVELGPNSVLIDGGEKIPYDKLLLSTGASPITPNISGAESQGVFAINTLADAIAIATYIQNAEHAVFIGGGRMCLHVIDAFLRRGLRVTIIETADEILLKMMDLEGARIVRRSLEERGVTIHSRTTAERILTEDGKGSAVVTDKGEGIEADIIISSVGSRPNIKMLRDGGVAVGSGILVDDTMRTSLENVYAAGDVAESFDLIRKGERVVCGTWFEAVLQGRIAGHNLTGDSISYDGSLRMNVIDSEGIGVASIGETEPIDKDCEVIVTREDKDYRKIIIKEDRIIGAILIGDVSDAGIIISLIRNRIRISSRKDLNPKRRLNAASLINRRRSAPRPAHRTP